MKEDAQELLRKLKQHLKRKGRLKMKCSNPACSKELFNVTVQHRSLDRDHPDRLPVKLVCAKCGKPVKVWIINEQMKEMLVMYNRLVGSFSALVRSFEDLTRIKSTKPWWKFW